MLGGNKSLLFNVEQLITIAGPVRLILFYDAGQVQDSASRSRWKEDRSSGFRSSTPSCDPFAPVR